MYNTIEKEEILQAPQRYAWNIVLRHKQFTEEELLKVKEYLALPEMIRFQHAASLAFLRTHFQKEIDDCLEVDWLDVSRWIAARHLEGVGGGCR